MNRPRDALRNDDGELILCGRDMIHDLTSCAWINFKINWKVSALGVMVTRFSQRFDTRIT